MMSVLENGGEAGALILAKDWSKTPMGPISTWPKTLMSTIGMILSSRQPMFLWWGPDLVQFYNDAYIPSFGRGKHPRALGQPGRECWREIWEIIGPQIEDVMKRKKATWHEDALVPIERNGGIEEVYWTYGYSPAFDDDGKVAGTLVVCTETTGRVLGERRSDALRHILFELSPRAETGEIAASVRRSCAQARSDIPFFALYERGPEGFAPLAADDLPPASVAEISRAVNRHAADEPRPGPRHSIVEMKTAPRVASFDEPVTRAVLVSPPTMRDHVFVFGASPRLPLSDDYIAFFRQLVEHVDAVAARLETLRARTELESERRNLLLQAPMGTALLTGPTHVFELANRRYREMIGGRELVGRPYREAFPELAGTEIHSILDDVYQTGKTFFADEHAVVLDRKGDGALEEIYLRLALEPVRDQQSNVYGILAVAVDITEQVRSRRELERTTEEREKLLQQLEEANRAKDEFLATVSHELRTPLTSILGWASLLRETDEQKRLQKGLAVIERNARAQAKLIEDILDVSRIISGKFRVNMRRVNPAAVAHAALETVRPIAAIKNIALNVSIDPDLGHLVADEDRLQQVVWNLLSNAVKFTPKGGEISLRLAREGSEAVLVVRDTGRGISPDFLPYIFERFRQGDTSTTKGQPGLGLGLAIVRHLVDLHGGQISAASPGEGGGAIFEVRIPIQAIEPTKSPRTRHDGDAHVHVESLRGVQILVLEDQDDARELTALALEDAGARVLQAESVRRALELLESEPFDVLVSDIGLPGEDGYAFIERVRDMNDQPDVQELPAVALTAFARPEDRTRALAAGFQEHMAKPVRPQQLVETVANLIGG
jgi:PAS domain S-box-containing protein